MKATAAFLPLLILAAGFTYSEASLSRSYSYRSSHNHNHKQNNQHLKPLQNVPRNDYSSIYTGRQTCIPQEDGVSVTSTFTYASIPVTIEPTTRRTRLSTSTSTSQDAVLNVLTSPKDVVTVDNDSDDSNSNSKQNELRFISTNLNGFEPTIPAEMTIQFPSHKLHEVYVDGTDNVQVLEASSFAALERVVVAPSFSGRLLIQDHNDGDGDDTTTSGSYRTQQALHLVVDCQSCLVQVLTFPRWIRLHQSGGTVEIHQGTLDAASRFSGGTLLVQGKIQGLDARKALAGEGAITTTTAENCHNVLYDGFWGQPCQTIHDNAISKPEPFEGTATPCLQTCHSVVSKSGDLSCSCESNCNSKSHTTTTSSTSDTTRSSSSGESSERTTTSSSSSSSSNSNDGPASSSSSGSSWSGFNWHHNSDSSGWWSNSGFWDDHNKHHSSSSAWGGNRKKKNSQSINPIHAKASTIGGLWRALAH